MKKKIKSVKLKQDLPDFPKGTEGKYFSKNDYDDDIYEFYYNGFAIRYCIKAMERNPDWFEIKYEPEPKKYFEVDIPNQLDSRLDKDKRDIVLHYFAKLAEYLNGLNGWEFEMGCNYRVLTYDWTEHKIGFIEQDWSILPLPKFHPDTETNEIREHAKPEMIEAYIEVCKNQIY